MNSSNKTAVAGKTAICPTTWCWRRWIASGRQDLWTARIQAVEGLSCVLTERPHHSRLLLQAYTQRRADAVALIRKYGGKVHVVKTAEWIQSRPAPPLRIGRSFQIVHDKTKASGDGTLPQLYIPQGIAFGSGEHATTHMLLRALVRHQDWPAISVLDLGTGSGVLALTARFFGARKIMATDFDPDAVRTARENEALNFSAPLIRWQCADVKKLRAATRHDLVLANLFSGILCEAAPQIAGCLSASGRLWLSGVLRSQQEEVTAAYRRQRLQLIRAVSRGKWIMLQWQKNDQPASLYVTGGAMMKTIQTK